VASDYTSGLIRLLAQAEPSRITLLVGKLTALILLTLVGTLVATGAAAGTAYLIAPSFDVSTSAWSTDTLATLLEAYRNISLSTLVWGVIGFALAMITRSSGFSIAVVIGWVVVFEVMLTGTAPDIADWMPGTILTALAAGGLPNVEFDTAVMLAAVYTVVAMVIVGIIVKRREITY
jgi:ABC-type transport system involved in multi-copper enzyme maturation permease subunit